MSRTIAVQRFDSILCAFAIGVLATAGSAAPRTWRVESSPTNFTGSFVSNSTNHLQVFSEGVPAPSVAEDSPPDFEVASTLQLTDKDKLLWELRSLARRTAGKGERFALDDGIVDDAIAVVQAWPSSVPLPVLDIDDDGHIVLDVLDEAGYAIAGFDITGERHSAVYSVVSGSKILKAGTLDTRSTSQTREAFRNVQLALV